MIRKRCLNCRQLTSRGSYCARCKAERAQRYSNTEYQNNRAVVLAAAGYQCHCPGCGVCDGHCTRVANTVDHITALDNGGSSAISNLRSCCVNCNASKKNR